MESVFLSWDPMGWVLIRERRSDSAWTYLELLGSPTVVACSWIPDPRIPQCSVHPQPRSASARGNELGCWLLSRQLAATSGQVSRALDLGAAKVRSPLSGPDGRGHPV